MDYPSHYNDIKTGRSSLLDWLNKNYPKFLDYLLSTYKDIDIKQALYMFYEKIDSIPLCECGNPVKFHGYKYGFSKFCCPSCAGKNDEVRSKLVNTLKSNHGENYKDKINEKIAETKLKRYGNTKYNNIEKFKQTCIDRYGEDNPMKIKQFQEKSKQTCLDKYGAEYVLSSEAFLKNKSLYTEKSKKTCMDRYGGSSGMSNESVKDKVRHTCRKKYGVDWNCMRPEARNQRNCNSKPNEMFIKLLNEYNIQYEREFRIGDKSYDFKIDNYLIEVNPSATHNINWNPYGGKIMGCEYHFNKTELAKQNGYNVINIWDWDDIYKILNMISPKTTVFARNCELKEITVNECNKFLNDYHIQNTCNGQTIKIGLYYNNILISVMTFGKPRYNKKYEWELLRLCFHKDYKVIGGSSKMFKYFVSTYNPDNIISYCDNSKFNGDVYVTLGFLLKSKRITPSKHWYNIKTKTHITDNLLRQKGFDKLFGTDYGKGTSNEDLMREHGFVEIFDSGQNTYVWKNLI